MTVVAVVVAVLLTSAAALGLVRVLRGPSSLDRLVAVDLVVAVAVCALAAFAGLTDSSMPIPAVLALTLVGFVGSVSVTRFRVPDTERDTGGAGSADGPPRAAPIGPGPTS